jgi:hypothetical protein
VQVRDFRPSISSNLDAVIGEILDRHPPDNVLRLDRLYDRNLPVPDINPATVAIFKTLSREQPRLPPLLSLGGASSR